MDRSIHVVSFDIPYPADYGGVIDVYFKLKALAQLGIKIHLDSMITNRGIFKKRISNITQIYFIV